MIVDAIRQPSWRDTATDGERQRSLAPAAPLPPPTMSTTEALGSVEAELHRLIVRQRDDGAKHARHSVDAQGKELRACLARAAAAAEEEKRNQKTEGLGFFDSLGKLVSDFVDDVAHLRIADALEHAAANLDAAAKSPRFWADLEAGARIIAKGAAIVAAAAATVATVGAAGPSAVVLVGVGLSALSVVDGEVHALEKLGVSAETAGWIRLGVGVAGAATTGVGGALAGGAGGGTLSRVANYVHIGSGGLGGGARVVEGASHLRTAEFEARALEARAAREQESHGQARLERSLATLLSSVKEAQASAERALTSLAGAARTKNDTLTLASRGG